MQDNKYSFVIEYQNGLRITCYDLTDDTTEFWVKVFIKQQKRQASVKMPMNGLYFISLKKSAIDAFLKFHGFTPPAAARPSR
jgi:hypothetical protein